jgi:solute:Na+ symporter, SSS family
MVLLIATAAYLLLNLFIGFWASKKVHNSEDFVLAGRNLNLSMASTTIFATWFGSETIMSSSAEFAVGGFSAVIKDPFGASLCLLIIGLFFTGPLYRLKIITLSDYFRIRFNKQAELVSAALMSFSYISWIAAQMVALGTILSVLAAAAGLEIGITAGILTGALLVTFYTAIGGMWAVSLTDFLQSIVIIVGLLLLTIILGIEMGGLGKVLADKPEGFFSLLPQKGSSIAVYGEAWLLVGLGSIASQDVFQRTMSAKNEKTAVRAVFLSSFLYLSVAMLPLLLGLFGKEMLPELLDGSDETKQMLLPSLVLAKSPVWLQILFFGALISAIMSTTSGAILAPASVFTENLIKPFFPKLKDSRMLLLLRFSVLFFSGLALWQALGGDSIYNLAADSSALTLVALFVPLSFGIYWKRTSGIAALASMISGFALWLAYDYIWPAAEWPSIFPATLLSFATIVLFTYLFPDKKQTQAIEP